MNDEPEFGGSDWTFLCPACKSTVRLENPNREHCRACGLVLAREGGVWPMMSTAELERYTPFLRNYTEVRLAEGRGDYGPELLRELPDCPAMHPLASQWRIRASSFAALRRVLAKTAAPASRILDLGAGVGWLSHRLRADGYRPCAIDISIDDDDGLGAARYFDPDWPRLRASLDNLPLADDSADGAIFNASFHYSENAAVTLAEAVRVIRPGGLIVILDTPFYRDAASGEQMREESQQYFERLIGRRSDSIDSIGYLTWDRLNKLGADAGLQWQVEQPWYGLRWALRPLLARLRRLREPATFAIAWAHNR